MILIGTAALVGSESSSDLPVASRDELVRAYNGKYSRFLALLMPCANTHLIGIVANLRLQLPYVKVLPRPHATHDALCQQSTLYIYHSFPICRGI